METTTSFRIDLANGSRLGPGKVALLEAVREHRSIAASARSLGMSYGRAWLLIDDMNKAFREPVVETFPGRSQAAGAMLTPFGAQIAALYREAEAAALAIMEGKLREITALTNPAYKREK